MLVLVGAFFQYRCAMPLGPREVIKPMPPVDITGKCRKRCRKSVQKGEFRVKKALITISDTLLVYFNKI